MDLVEPSVRNAEHAGCPTTVTAQALLALPAPSRPSDALSGVAYLQISFQLGIFDQKTLMEILLHVHSSKTYHGQYIETEWNRISFTRICKI